MSGDPTHPQAADVLVGHVLDGKYHLEARVAQAETGLIYRGTNVTIGTTVAIKIMPPFMQGEAALVERFERETRLRSLLEHPNCVAVLDHGRDAEGRLYTVMEYVEGRRLSDLVAEAAPMPLERIVRIGSQVLAALEEAHAHGIVHGEVKPFSVQVTDRPADPDFVQLLGFGRLQDALLKGERFEAEAAWASPEQLRADDDIHESSDIYAVGAMLYAMLTGRPPWAGSRAEIVAQQASGALPPAPSAVRPGTPIDESLEALVMRCLEHEPAKRPVSVDALGRELLALARKTGAVGGLTGRISAVAPAVTLSSDNLAAVSSGAASRQPSSRRGVIVAGAAVGLLVVALVLWFALGGSDPATESDAAHAATRDDDPAPALPVADDGGGGRSPPEVSAASAEAIDDGLAAEGGEVVDGAVPGEPRRVRRAGDPLDEPFDEVPEGEAEDLATAFVAGGEPGAVRPEEPRPKVEYNEEDVDRELAAERRKKRDKRREERRRDSVTQTMLDKAAAYLKEGNKAGARALIERVLERDPQNRQALKLKRKLD